MSFSPLGRLAHPRSRRPRCVAVASSDLFEKKIPLFFLFFSLFFSFLLSSFFLFFSLFFFHFYLVNIFSLPAVSLPFRFMEVSIEDVVEEVMTSQVFGE